MERTEDGITGMDTDSAIDVQMIESDCSSELYAASGTTNANKM